MTAQTTPEERRVALKAAWSRTCAALLVKHGVQQGEVADECGVDDSLVQRWCDPRRADSMTPADVQLVALRWPALGRDLLAALADPCGLVVVARHVAGPDALTVKAAAQMLRASSIAADSLLAALEDGIVDPAERRDALRKLDAVICDAEALRTACMADELPKLRVAGGGR